MMARSMAEATALLRPASVWLSFQLALWRYGMVWPIALLLALAAAFVHVGVAQRAATVKNEARASLERTTSRQSSGSVVAETGDSAALERLAAVLRADDALGDEVRDLYGIAAASQLPIGAARFGSTDDPGSGLRRLTISLPVTGHYGDVRRFVDAGLLQLPNLSIDEIAMSGGKGPDASLDIHLRLSLWGRSRDGLPRAPPAAATGGH